MAEGRQRAQWNQTSSILAMIHNVNLTKKQHAKPPQYFNPMYKPGRAKKLGKAESMSALKAAFIKET